MSWAIPAALALVALPPLTAYQAQAQSIRSQNAADAIAVPNEIRATPGAATPLQVMIRAPESLPRQVIMLVRGLPANITLSEGRAFGPGVWAVPPANVERAKLFASGSATGTTEISVALVTLEGATLAEARTVLRIGAAEATGGLQENTVALTTVPVKPSASETTQSAPSTRTLTPAKLSPEAEDRLAKLIEKGDDSMRAGKVAAARLFYQHAADGGSSAGALALGSTYDANELRHMSVVGGVQPDAKLARQWYNRAWELGSQEAATRMQRLSAR